MYHKTVDEGKCGEFHFAEKDYIWICTPFFARSASNI